MTCTKSYVVPPTEHFVCHMEHDVTHVSAENNIITFNLHLADEHPLESMTFVNCVVYFCKHSLENLRRLRTLNFFRCSAIFDANSVSGSSLEDFRFIGPALIVRNIAFANVKFKNVHISTSFESIADLHLANLCKLTKTIYDIDYGLHHLQQLHFSYGNQNHTKVYNWFAC